MTDKTMPDVRSLSEDVYHAIIEAIPHVIWVAQSNGDVTFLNQAWKEWTGREVKDSWETRWAESIHPDDAPAQLAKWERAYSEGAPYEGECRFLTKDGSYKHASFIGVPVRDGSGTITNWFGIDLDVTDLKRTEEELRDKIRKLEIANDAMVDRELRMVELKDEIRRLRALTQHDHDPDTGEQGAER